MCECVYVHVLPISPLPLHDMRLVTSSTTVHMCFCVYALMCMCVLRMYVCTYTLFLHTTIEQMTTRLRTMSVNLQKQEDEVAEG